MLMKAMMVMMTMVASNGNGNKDMIVAQLDDGDDDADC